jgi:hypothetical protein
MSIDGVVCRRDFGKAGRNEKERIFPRERGYRMIFRLRLGVFTHLLVELSLALGKN